jgi:hypothetical protein
MAVTKTKSTKKDIGDIYLSSKGGFYSHKAQKNHQFFSNPNEAHGLVKILWQLNKKNK